MIVTVQHLDTIPAWNGRRGWCHSSSRVWFQRYALDWADFVRCGIDADLLLATGDAMALRLVLWAEEVERGQQ